MIAFWKSLFARWTWLMAWRDSRASRRKLILFSCSIVIGIAALVAISSFAVNLQMAVEEQAKTLLGADLVLTSRDPFTPEMEKMFNSIGGQQAREVIFSSMIYFSKSGGTRLAQIRAVQAGFPFYGQYETEPPSAGNGFQTNSAALVEQSLLLMFNATAGEKVKIGDVTIPVAGALLKVPGENTVFATISPRVYIPYQLLSATGLIRSGSFARFKVFFKLPDGTDVKAIVRRLRKDLEKLQLTSDTVEERKESMGRSLENLHHFLNLGGFIALLLGAIGIASAIHAHVTQKTGSVAVLRCLGAPAGQTVAIYLAQAIALGIFGAVAGGLLGLIVQFSLPKVVADFLPFQLDMRIVWLPLIKAILAGFLICIVFALLPLVSLRKISPLAVLRSSFEHSGLPKDPAHWLIYAIIAAGLLLFARSQTHRIGLAFAFAGGLLFAFLLLAAAAWLTRGLAGKIISERWPFVWRQGLANLYRPNNRTLVLLLSLGLGTFLVLTMELINYSLGSDLFPPDKQNQPNAALFDIQSDQWEGVEALLKDQGLPVLQNVPMITMRLSEIKGELVRELLKKKHDLPRWALRREYRSTYRDTLEKSSEDSVAGSWPAAKKGDLVPISIERDIAEELKVALGDKITFDVQGLPIQTYIANIRKVDWKRIQPNFFVVFPSGVLEEAPTMRVITTRVPSREQSAKMQRSVVEKFPNISTIDLALVLDTIDSVLRKVSFVIKFMAAFTILTGLIVLMAAILTGRYQRVQESILLRTLGASKKQVQRILLVEYFLLGFLAAFTAVLLAETSSWALAKFLFKTGYTFLPAPPLIALGAVSALTIIIGLLGNRGVLNKPPLEILRQAG
jgi:putative ABC transport system permease protein